MRRVGMLLASALFVACSAQTSHPSALGEAQQAVRGDARRCPLRLPSVPWLSTPGSAAQTSAVDVDLDGNLNLLVLGGETGAAVAYQLDVALGKGDGTFRTGKHLITQTRVRAGSFAVADFTSDGLPDVVMTGAGVGGSGPSLGLLVGHGDGTFAPAVVTPLAGVGAVVTGDFDRDGRADVAIATGIKVNVLLGHGDGTFAAPVSHAAGSAPASLVTGDFDGDGVLNLAAALFSSGASTGELDLLRGRGNGTFHAAVSSPLPPVFGNFFTGDFDGDGRLDIVAEQDQPGGGLVIAFNAGGSFGAPVPVALAPSVAAAGDFDGDGKDDLVMALVAPGATSRLGVMLSAGDGTFVAAGTAAAEVSAGAVGPITTGDFDGDGHLDAVSSNVGGTSVVLGSGGGGLVGPALYAEAGAYSVASADLDGDGWADLLMGNGPPAGGGQLGVRLGGPGGSFGVETSIALPALPIAIATGDFDEDRHPDVAVAMDAASAVDVLLGAGDGTLGPPIALAGCPGTAHTVAVADLDGDGHLDLVAGGTSGKRGTVSPLVVWLGRGDGTFAAATGYAGWEVITALVADFTGDGVPDVATVASERQLVGLHYTTVYSVQVRPGTGGGALGAVVQYPTSALPTAGAAADLDGDGRVDLAVAYTDGRVGVLPGVAGGLGAEVFHSVGLYCEGVTLADVNGDGNLDLIAGDQYLVATAVSLGDGAGGFGPGAFYPLGGAGIVAEDFDHDGRSDLAIASGFSAAVLLQSACR